MTTLFDTPENEQLEELMNGPWKYIRVYSTYPHSLWFSRGEIIELSDARGGGLLDNFVSRTIARAKCTQDGESKRIARK